MRERNKEQQIHQVQKTTCRCRTSHRALTGSHVTTTQPTGDVIISSGVTKLKGKTIELAPGTTIGIGAKLEINN